MDVIITYSNATASASDFLTAYCINPPDNDNCPYGPCPNTDVTGLGQQVSMYISATVFIITLVHIPREIRLAWFAYLVNVIAFLTSALLSIWKQQLTRDDAIFAIIATASPGSIYVWCLFPSSIFYLLRRKRLPKYLDSLGKYERLGFLSASALTFVGWVMLFYMTFHPKMAERLSQKDCNRPYDKANTLFQLIWAAMFFTQCFALMFVVVLTLVLQRLFSRSRHSIKFQPSETGISGTITLASWTFQSLKRLHTDMGFAHWSRPVLVAQLVPFCHSLLDFGQSNQFALQDFEVVLLCLFLLSLVSSMLRNWRVWSWFSILMIALSAFLIAVPFVWSTLTPSLSMILLPLLGFVTLTDVGRVTKESSIAHKLRAYWPLCIILFASLLSSNNFWFPQAFQDKLENSSYGINLAVLIVYEAVPYKLVTWVVLWQVSSFRPSRHFLGDLERLWRGIITQSAMFKFVNLVLIPTVLWLYAATGSLSINAQNDLAGTQFGQVYSLVTALFAVVSLFVDLAFHWKKFKKVLVRGYHDIIQEANSPPQNIERKDLVEGSEEKVLDPTDSELRVNETNPEVINLNYTEKSWSRV